MSDYREKKTLENSPWKFVLLIVAAVAIAESAVMVVLDMIWPHQAPWEFVADAFLLVLLISPLLYVWLYRPLVMQIEERHAAEAKLETAVRELTEALENVRSLRGLLPICAWCKKIRNDGGYWQQLEAYVLEHSEAEFSHGICPECARQVLEDLDEEEAEGEGAAPPADTKATGGQGKVRPTD